MKRKKPGGNLLIRLLVVNNLLFDDSFCLPLRARRILASAPTTAATNSTAIRGLGSYRLPFWGGLGDLLRLHRRRRSKLCRRHVRVQEAYLSGHIGREFYPAAA